MMVDEGVKVHQHHNNTSSSFARLRRRKFIEPGDLPGNSILFLLLSNIMIFNSLRSAMNLRAHHTITIKAAHHQQQHHPTIHSAIVVVVVEKE